MAKTAFYWRRYLPGCPQQVIAHAEYQRARGRGISLSYRGINNPRLALKKAQSELNADVRMKKLVAQKVAEEAQKLPRVWRDDNNDARQPTVSTIVSCAEDLVAVDDRYFYRLYIVHVMSFHGNGFMPRLRFLDTSCGNGEVHVCVDRDARDLARMRGRLYYEDVTTVMVYDAAVAEGEAWLARKLREDELEVARARRRRYRH